MNILKLTRTTVQLLFCLSLIHMTSSLSAQHNVIKTSLYGFRGAGLGYERALNYYSSASINVYTKHRTYGRENVFSNKTRGLDLEYRFYINGNKSPMHGFYLGPNLTFRRHQLKYYNDPNPDPGENILRGLFGLIFFQTFEGFGNNSEPLPIVEGSQKVNSTSLGIKLGYVKNWENFYLDFGLNLQRNLLHSNTKGVPLSNGLYQGYTRDVKGDSSLFVLGMAYAF